MVFDMKNKDKFDYAGFQQRLKAVIAEKANGKPGRFAAMAREFDRAISNGAMAAYTQSRIPGLDKAWAIANAAKISLDELAGRSPSGVDRYRRALWILFRKTIDSTIVDFSRFKNEALLEEFVDTILASEKNRPKKPSK